MKLSSQAENILAQINTKTKLGDLRKIAKDIKKDHELAMELWSTERFLSRQLAILIMDNKLLSHNMNRKVVIILGTIILVVGGLFTFLGLTIVNSKGCSQIVIDTNELHSGIDIPDVDFINCYFDEQKKIRSRFTN